jgi:signal peptidase II
LTAAPVAVSPRVGGRQSDVSAAGWQFLRRASGIAALAFIGDELLKMFVRARLAQCDVDVLAACERLDLVGPLHLVRAENAGSAFGYAQGWTLWLVLATVGVLLIVLYAVRLRNGGWLAAFGVGLQAGGAVANLLDRVVLGGATDMLYAETKVVWNLADLALVAGTLMATWALLRSAIRTRPG